MPFVGQGGPHTVPGAERESRDAQAPPPPPSRRAVTALMLAPGALVVFTGFNAGGYFPATTAIVAVVLTQILLVRIVRSRRPLEGLAPATLVAIATLGLYALATLVSATWSHSPGRALIEFDRAWMYLLILVLFGTVRASTRDLRWLVRGLAIGIAVVCLAGLISRVLPEVWHTAPGVSNERLSYPVTYWNTLGLLAALGIVLALGLTCSLGERRAVRVLAAAVVPLLAATLFFTFSRGAMAAGALGVIVYVLVARPRGLLSGALATLPPTAALVLLAYHANLLDTIDPTTPAAVSQGHRVALVAGVCALSGAGLRLLLAIGLDPRLRRIAHRTPMRPGVRVAAIAGTLAAAVALAIALGLPHTLQGDWHRFLSGATPGGRSGDLRARLADPSNDGRTDLWRVALRGFSASPVHGSGAGMYQTLWDRGRPRFVYTINAHSLYLQAMAELGSVGLALLLIAIVAVLAGLGMRARGSRRSIYGVLLAACAVWVVRAGVDWDWEMPVVTLVFFAIAGAGLSPRSERGPGWTPGARGRVILGLLGVLTLVLPVLIVGSQTRLQQAERALYASDCSRAASAARSSIGWLALRPEPYEILGLCDLRRGLPGQAVAAMRQAVHRDPGSWETYYTLALAQAAAGIDPRPAAERALRMNPLEPLTRQAVSELQGTSPARWAARARGLRADALGSRDLSIVPS